MQNNYFSGGMLTEDNIIDCGFLYIFYLFRMATTAVEFVAHHEAVQQHIQEELTKQNTSIISDAQLTEIRQHLLGNLAVGKITKRKINRNILNTFVDDPDVAYSRM